MKTILARPWLGLALCWSLSALSQTALAQTDATPPSPARSLSCLLRPERAPSYPARHQHDHGFGHMRVLLRFEQPDAAPKVEVLVNNAREDMQDQVYRYLGGYRLPCLQPGDGPVSAVQEFNFHNGDRDPVPLAADDGAGKSCLVTPRRDVTPPYIDGREVMHVVAVAAFNGDGAQAPEVKIIHSTASPKLEQLAVERMGEYRMPCRRPGDEARVVRQHFVFRPAAASLYTLKREAFGLGEFLGMTKGAHQLQAFFDFRTMGCPFKVNYRIHAPVLPNEVWASGPADPNRQPFLHWLGERELNFGSDKVANDLFGQVMQLSVPCGELNLRPEPS